MITAYGIKCQIEDFIGKTVIILFFGIPSLILLYVMYLQSGGQPFVEDVWLYIENLLKENGRASS